MSLIICCTQNDEDHDHSASPDYRSHLHQLTQFYCLSQKTVVTVWWSPSSRPGLKWSRRTHSVLCSQGKDRTRENLRDVITETTTHSVSLHDIVCGLDANTKDVLVRALSDCMKILLLTSPSETNMCTLIENQYDRCLQNSTARGKKSTRITFTVPLFSRTLKTKSRTLFTCHHFFHYPQLGTDSCWCSCYPSPCVINKTNSNHCCPCDSFVPFPLLIFLPYLPPSTQSLALFSVHRSMHPCSIHAAGPLLSTPQTHSFLVSFLPFLPFFSFLPSSPLFALSHGPGTGPWQTRDQLDFRRKVQHLISSQVPDVQETVVCSVTRSRDGTFWCQGSTFSMETQEHLRYHNSQNQDKDYCVSKKDTKLQTGWGVEDVDRTTVGEVGRGSSSLCLRQWLLRDNKKTPICMTVWDERNCRYVLITHSMGTGCLYDTSRSSSR